jgi:hypothetical protein
MLARPVVGAMAGFKGVDGDVTCEGVLQGLLLWV